jgi:hypothetical protein
MAVFWVVAPCSLVNVHQSTRRCNPEDSHLDSHTIYAGGNWNTKKRGKFPWRHWGDIVELYWTLSTVWDTGLFDTHDVSGVNSTPLFYQYSNNESPEYRCKIRSRNVLYIRYTSGNNVNFDVCVKQVTEFQRRLLFKLNWNWHMIHLISVNRYVLGTGCRLLMSVLTDWLECGLNTIPPSLCMLLVAPVL